MSPKVSVIVPNYNHGVYLKQRIDSVLNQTFKDFELIILDDCSTDNSVEIIKQYSNSPHITSIIINDKNSGSPFIQWQKGISLAKGEWIWIAESDDYADKHFLQSMITQLTGKKNVGLAYCDSNIVNGDKVQAETFATIKNLRFNTNRWSENHFNDGLNEIENYLLLGGSINNTSAVLFNRKALLAANIFNHPFRYIGDKYTFVKILATTNVVYNRESLNYYRDPFSAKHADRFILYFYEHFILFDWVLKNIKLINNEKFLTAFYQHTRNSLFRDWGIEKVKLYVKMFSINKGLFLKNVIFNFKMALQSAIKQ